MTFIGEKRLDLLIEGFSKQLSPRKTKNSSSLSEENESSSTSVSPVENNYISDNSWENEVLDFSHGMLFLSDVDSSEQINIYSSNKPVNTSPSLKRSEPSPRESDHSQSFSDLGSMLASSNLSDVIQNSTAPPTNLAKERETSHQKFSFESNNNFSNVEVVSVFKNKKVKTKQLDESFEFSCFDFSQADSGHRSLAEKCSKNDKSEALDLSRGDLFNILAEDRSEDEGNDLSQHLFISEDKKCKQKKPKKPKKPPVFHDVGSLRAQKVSLFVLPAKLNSTLLKGKSGQVFCPIHEPKYEDSLKQISFKEYKKLCKAGPKLPKSWAEKLKVFPSATTYFAYPKNRYKDVLANEISRVRLRGIPFPKKKHLLSKNYFFSSSRKSSQD